MKQETKVTAPISSPIWENYTLEDLKKLKESFEYEAVQLMLRHLDAKVRELKEDYFNRKPNTPEDINEMYLVRGHIIGLELLKDLKDRVDEEIENRGLKVGKKGL